MNDLTNKWHEYRDKYGYEVGELSDTALEAAEREGMSDIEELDDGTVSAVFGGMRTIIRVWTNGPVAVDIW